MILNQKSNIGPRPHLIVSADYAKQYLQQVGFIWKDLMLTRSTAASDIITQIFLSILEYFGVIWFYFVEFN